jgi:hypothetical protein
LTLLPRSALEKSVPFENLTGIDIGGHIPVRVFFDRNGDLKVDATIYDKDGSLAAIVKTNDFTILKARWDRNWDQTSFEIVDENRIPFFQIERPQPNNIRLRGIFRTDKGSALVSSNDVLALDPPTPVPAPIALFMYPSTTNLHKRVSHAN